MSNSTLIGYIITLAILLIFSAFVSATEIAYTGLNEVRLRKLAETKKSARRALKMRGELDRVISALLIFNNVVNITAASIATLVFIHFYGDAGVTISTIVMTSIILVFCEITPKGLAKERPEAFAIFISFPLMLTMFILQPFIYLFDLWKRFLKKIFRLRSEQVAITEEEFKMIVNDIKDDGVINSVEHKLINNALRYDSTFVSKIMTPIEDAQMIDIIMPLAEIRKIFEETSYSRIPIYEGDKTNIVGVLYVSDFYEMMLSGGDSIKPIIKQVLKTKARIKISKLFANFQKQKKHIAMVYSGETLCGLITMEDILEEIVGEINDESDGE